MNITIRTVDITYRFFKTIIYTHAGKKNDDRTEVGLLVFKKKSNISRPATHYTW